jgi:hypothetical protein
MNTLYDTAVEAFALTHSRVSLFRNTCDRFGITLSRKQLSEMLSGVVETAFEDAAYFHEGTIIAPKADDKADLIVDGIDLEIKTKYGKSGDWRGGAFSKREADYLFISWVDEPFGMFAIHKYVTEDMWRGGNVGNYYATYMSLEDVMDGVTLIGETVKARTRFHTVPEVF